MEGPQFSTLAESEWHRRNGFDLIGMTTVPEAKLAREAEICYATLAFVTDYDCWHPSHASVTADMVVRVLQQNVANAQTIIQAVVPAVDDQRTCRCHTALQNAILTQPERIPPETRAKLDLFIGKYLG